MKNIISKLLLGSVLVVSATYSSAKTVVFDTVTSYQSGKDSSNSYPYTSYSVISGIEKDTGLEVSAQFGSYTYQHSGNGVAQICTPSVITSMEKPGRYYLHVTWDDSDRFKQVTHCALELKNIPE